MSRSQSEHEHGLHRIRNYVLLLVPLAIIPIAAGWVGDIAKDWITHVNPYPSQRALLVGGLALLFSAAVWLVRKGRFLLPARVLEQSQSFEPRRVVIALLSPSDSDLQPGADGAWEARGHKSEPWVSLKGKTLEQLVAKAKDSGLPQWKWQQTLRAAARHGAVLERLVLVGSTGAKGSGTKEQLDLAKAFLGAWLPSKVEVVPATPGGEQDADWQADFEDLDGLGRLLRKILRELGRAGYRERDIIIDCTGGFKVASIAAALVTLDRPELMFQYVGTGEHAGDVIGFDVATEHPGG